MSSDEDFSLVVGPAQPSEDTLEGIKALITNYKEKHAQLVQEQQELATCRDDLREWKEKFKQRSVKLAQSLKDGKRLNEEQMENEKAKLHAMKQEEMDLMKEIQRVKEALEEDEADNALLKEQTKVFTAVPEREVVFKGATGDAADTPTFTIDSRIVYPMDGGTALVTFEDEVVTQKILELEKHQVELGEERSSAVEARCSITVEARPVHLLLPRLVEIDTEVSPHHILISNLPEMDADTLLNKLEIHFSKTRHGGGEVDKCEMLPDSGTVVLSFIKKDIAGGLTETEFHDVKLQQKKHRVRATPFLNGQITNLETKMTACPRTVLLTGIPDVMERETLQDLLEIHFQKSINGGGEIEAFLYNPLGQKTSARFEGVSSDRKE